MASLTGRCLATERQVGGAEAPSLAATAAAGEATLGRRCGHGHCGIAERQVGGAGAPSSAATAAAGGAEATCHCERAGGSARRAAQGSVVAAAVGGAEAPHHHEWQGRRVEDAVECQQGGRN